jgi:exopolysaccharide biosynthesis polyprenyl glycosylphosphotransferase
MSSPTGSLTSVDVQFLNTAEWSARLAPFFAKTEKLFDFLAVLGAICVSYAVYQAIEPGRSAFYPSSTVVLSAAAFALLFVFLLERHGGYRPSVSLLAIRETERILRVTLQAFLLAVLAAYFFATPVSRLAFSLSLVTVPLSLTLEKWEMHRLLRLLREKGYGSRRAVIFGTGAEARRIYSALLRSPKFGVDPIAFVDSDPQGETTEIYEPFDEHKHSAPVLPGPLRPELFRQLRASVLVVAELATDREAMLRATATLLKSGINIYFAPTDFLEPGGWVDFAELDGVMLAHLSRPTSRVIYETGKRLLDLMAAVVLLPVLAVLGPFIAVLVKATSPGPVLFRQERVGRVGRRFTMYKFRTMYRDAPEYGISPGAGDDPRITPVGRFLRHTSLDELPQLINVLLGHMSLVGPRPEMPFLVERYTALEHQRLTVKPGITGLWQISPARAFPIHENLEYDLYYVRHRSLFMDVAILLHTLLFAARGV